MLARFKTRPVRIGLAARLLVGILPGGYALLIGPARMGAGPHSGGPDRGGAAGRPDPDCQRQRLAGRRQAGSHLERPRGAGESQPEHRDGHRHGGGLYAA